MPGIGDLFNEGRYGDAPVSARVIMRTWRQLVCEREPWSHIPSDDRSGELARFLEELLDPTGGLESTARRRRIRTTAATHGSYRSAQRCDEAILAEDFAHLRRAVRQVLRANGASHDVARDFVRHLLPDFRTAVSEARIAYETYPRGVEPSGS